VSIISTFYCQLYVFRVLW